MDDLLYIIIIICFTERIITRKLGLMEKVKAISPSTIEMLDISAHSYTYPIFAQRGSDPHQMG